MKTLKEYINANDGWTISIYNIDDRYTFKLSSIWCNDWYSFTPGDDLEDSDIHLSIDLADAMLGESRFIKFNGAIRPNTLYTVKQIAQNVGKGIMSISYIESVEKTYRVELTTDAPPDKQQAENKILQDIFDQTFNNFKESSKAFSVPIEGTVTTKSAISSLVNLTKNLYKAHLKNSIEFDNMKHCIKAGTQCPVKLNANIMNKIETAANGKTLETILKTNIEEAMKAAMGKTREGLNEIYIKTFWETFHAKIEEPLRKNLEEIMNQENEKQEERLPTETSFKGH